jgi:heterotetrameric sarcosine oxidase delta subunit
MSFLVPCPNCGERAAEEFGYRGEVTIRPTSAPSLRGLTDYLYMRGNVAGPQREWWVHRLGCGEWFVAERDTRTNAILEVELPG